MHEEKKTKAKDTQATPEGAVPAYLLDREGQTRAKVLSNMIKQKRKEKAVSFSSLNYIKPVDMQPICRKFTTINFMICKKQFFSQQTCKDNNF